MKSDDREIEHLLLSYRNKYAWVMKAQAFLQDRQTIMLSAIQNDYGRPLDDISFDIEVPREVWAPRLDLQIKKARAELDEGLKKLHECLEDIKLVDG